MAFARFNPCNPCCTNCLVNYSGIICPGQQFSGFPDYVDIAVSSVQVYVAHCSGYSADVDPNTLCNLCSGIGPPISNIFYPLLDIPSHSGMCTLNYNAEFDYPNNLYVLVTKSEVGDIYEVDDEIIDESNCAPFCSGDMMSRIIPTGWTGSNPCWWRTDYNNHPYSMVYTNQPQANLRSAEDGKHFWACTDNTGFSPTHYCCLGDQTDGINIFCSESTSHYIWLSKPASWNFTVDKFAIIANLLNPSLPGHTWTSLLLKESCLIEYVPNGQAECPITQTVDLASQDNAVVIAKYICAIPLQVSCLGTAALIMTATPTGIVTGGNFTGPTALSDATTFANSLPATIDPTVYPINFGTIYKSFTSQADSYVSTCPGSLTFSRSVSYSACGISPFPGSETLAITQ